MGNSKSKPKKKGHDCFTKKKKPGLNEFQLRWQNIWILTDQHLHAVLNVTKFPADIMEIIGIYLSKQSYFLGTFYEYIGYVRCVKKTHNIELSKDSLYQSPWKLCIECETIKNLKQDQYSTGKRINCGVFGAGPVGKSALVERYVCGCFLNEYDPGIEDIFRKKIEIDNQPFLMEIFDSYGQEEFMAMKMDWISSCDVFIVCFSVLRDYKGTLAAFNRIDEWIKDIIQIKQELEQPFAIIISGNKIDLRGQEREREIAIDVIMEKISDLGLPYIETTAKEDFNVSYLFKYAVYEYWFQTNANFMDWNKVLKVVNRKKQ